MLITDFIRRLKQARDRKMLENNAVLGRGGAASFDDYKRIVGKNQGLQELDLLINEVHHKEQEDE